MNLRLRNFGEGCVVTLADFLDIGSREAIDLVLHRLHQQGMIRRISRGIYEVPREDSELGVLALIGDNDKYHLGDEIGFIVNKPHY